MLLLDEPFSGGLDPSGILALKRILQRLARQSEVTVVMTTPVPELVEELADRIVVVRDADDLPSGQVQKPKSRSSRCRPSAKPSSIPQVFLIATPEKKH